LARTGDRNPRQSLKILNQFVFCTFLEKIQLVVVLCPLIRPSAVSASRRARAVVQLISSFVATNLMDTGILIFSMRSTTFSSNELFPSFRTLNDLFNQSLYNSKMRNGSLLGRRAKRVLHRSDSRFYVVRTYLEAYLS